MANTNASFSTVGVNVTIGTAISEVLNLGVPDGNNECILAIPDIDVPLGGKLY
jgi:hypothetical protein